MTIPRGDEAALSLTSAVVKDVVVIRAEGILDATTRRQFTDYLAHEAENRGSGLILDLAGVTFMDSRALGLIVHHWQRSISTGSHFALVGVQYSHSKVMWITGLAQRLPLFDTLEEALKSFASS